MKRITVLLAEDHLIVREGFRKLLESENDIEVVGEEPDKYYKKWGKPRTWYARAIREWKVSGDPSADARNWKPYTSFGDVADLAAAAGSAAPVYAATATVKADGAKKGFLGAGFSGKGTVELNGRQIMAEDGSPRTRVGQYKQPVELQAGENKLVFKVNSTDGKAALGALLSGPENDGEDLWQKLIRSHGNVRFVFSGHALCETMGALTSLRDDDVPVYQFVANYQTWDWGGAGYMRLIEFWPDAGQVHVRTYSPYGEVDPWLTDPADDMTFSYSF